MTYSELTLAYFRSAAGAGVLTGPHIHCGTAGSRAQGTWVRFHLEIRSGIIGAARFLAFGCPHTLAVAAWVTEQAPGRAAGPTLPESVEALRARFEVPLHKTGRLLIVEDAWRAALDPTLRGS